MTSLGADNFAAGDEADDELDDVVDGEDELGDAVCGVRALPLPATRARRERQVYAGRPRGHARYGQSHVRRRQPDHHDGDATLGSQPGRQVDSEPTPPVGAPAHDDRADRDGRQRGQQRHGKSKRQRLGHEQGRDDHDRAVARPARSAVALPRDDDVAADGNRGGREEADHDAGGGRLAERRDAVRVDGRRRALGRHRDRRPGGRELRGAGQQRQRLARDVDRVVRRDAAAPADGRVERIEPAAGHVRRERRRVDDAERADVHAGRVETQRRRAERDEVDAVEHHADDDQERHAVEVNRVAQVHHLQRAAYLRLVARTAVRVRLASHPPRHTRRFRSAVRRRIRQHIQQLENPTPNLRICVGYKFEPV